VRLAVGVVVFLLVFFTGAVATHADTFYAAAAATSTPWAATIDA
jgi:hypothetical protein